MSPFIPGFVQQLNQRQLDLEFDFFEWFFGEIDGAFDNGWGKYNTVLLKSTVRGAPLLISQWTIQSGKHVGETHNILFVVTSDNHVYAFAEDQLLTGSTSPLWSQSLGAPLLFSYSNIPAPIGISSTPVIDLDNQKIFILSLNDDGTGKGVYTITSLDINTGSILQQARLNDAGASGRPTFDGNRQDQRGALNLVGGRIYTIFADLAFNDLCIYYGWVVSINANNLDDQQFFSLTKNVVGGGAWGAGGVAAASDDTVYVATGNSPDSNPTPAPSYCPSPSASLLSSSSYWNQFAAGGTYAGKFPGDIGDYFEAVVRLGAQWIPSWTSQLVEMDWYMPSDAEALNSADLDLGGSSPLILPPISGKELLVVTGKSGDVFLLDRFNLGNKGGELSRLHAFAGESKCAPAYYYSKAGDHYVYVVGKGNPGLVAYKVVTSSTGTMSLVQVWGATDKIGVRVPLGDSPGSPLVTSIPAIKDYAMVWIVDDSIPALRAFDAITGNEVYNSSWFVSDTLDKVPHFAPITATGLSIIVGTNTGFSCYGQTQD